MTPLPPSSSDRHGRTLKNLALCFLLSGFALDLGGAILGNGTLFKVGIFLFLAGIPLLTLGLFLGRRKP